jgi:glycosyltransferase involved in cell wall biosynthesis
VSLIEAAAAGTPAVSTKVGGVADVVGDDAGLLAPAGDFESLGRAIAAAAADPEGRAAMGARARKHVAGRFSVERLVADVEGLYEGLLRAS